MRQSPKGRRRLGAACLLLAGLGVSGAARSARAEDWLQFRRDERRSAASKDRLPLPLTDLWSVPGYGTATWHGKAFYLGPDGAGAAVYCADMRTGVTLWKRPLSFTWNQVWNQLPFQRTPVAVSAEGTVFVQDFQPGTHGFVYPRVRTGSTGFVSHPFGTVPRGSFRAFRAADGTPVSSVSSPPTDVPVPRLVIHDGPAPGALPTEPALRGLIPTGPALVQGSEVLASSIDCLFRWTPGGMADLFSLSHTRPPVPGDFGIRDVTLGGYPPTSTGSGVVLGGMAWVDIDAGQQVGEKQFLALMKNGSCQWHRDYPWSLGIATVENDLVLTGAGDYRASWAVMAHDVNTGAVRWVYPRNGLQPDATGQATGGIRPVSAARPHGYLLNPGVAVSGGRAYAVVGRSVVCLSVAKGEAIWSWPFGAGAEGAPKSLVVTPTHVLISFDRETSKRSATGFESMHAGRVVALRVSDGQPVWSQPLTAGGDLALSEGMLFQSDTAVHAFAPAERTFRLAADSERPEDYDPKPGLNREPEARPAGKAEEKQTAPRGVADATLVCLYWGQPEEQMVKQLRDRRAAAPGMPLLVSLEWLDPTRTTILGGQSGWSPKSTAAFVALCERIAREAAPEHLDLAPEVNVWLARDGQRLPEVRNLLRLAAAAVKKASPQTRVLISLNREILARRYGRGTYSPFGKINTGSQEDQRAILALLNDADEVGLTCRPQSAFSSPAEIPGDYLLALKKELPQKLILLTRLEVTWDPRDKTPEITQASFLKHLIQAAYWLNAEIVAYPDLFGNKRHSGDGVPDVALTLGEEERLALAQWRNTLQWRRVTELSATAARLSQPSP